MGDELTSLLDMFHACKKAGKSATLTMSTKGGKAKVKFEAELNNAMPSSLSTTSPQSASAPSLPGCQAAGDRHRPRGSAVRRAKANARAALHQAFQALPFPGGDYSAAPGPPDPSPAQPLRPLQLHPTPTDENCRLILTVDRKAGFQPTFSQLDGEGDQPLDLPTSTPTSTPTTAQPSTMPSSRSSPPPTPQWEPGFPPPSELTSIPPRSANYCCHCRTECPCIFGRRCRGCPRQGGRPHDCHRCPGSWCRERTSKMQPLWFLSQCYHCCSIFQCSMSYIWDNCHWSS